MSRKPKSEPVDVLCRVCGKRKAQDGSACFECADAGATSAPLDTSTSYYAHASVRLADTPGPAAHGHVLWHDGELYRRVAVRIPLDLLDELSTGPIAPADHRTTHILSMQREMMTDASLNAVHRDKATVKP